MHKKIKRLGIIFLAMILMFALPLSTQAATSKNKAKARGDEPTISAGLINGISMAVKADGSLWTWGSSFQGRLFGDGKKEQFRKTPVKILNNVVSASGGSMLAAAIKEDGSLWAWGWFGGIGKEQLKPVKVMENVRSVSVGNDSAMVIKTDGSLWEWLGYTTKIMDNVAAVSSGEFHSMAIKTDGSLWAWGYNYNGQLGDGTTTDRTTPFKVMDNVAVVSANSQYTLAVKTDGTLWAWGGLEYAGHVGSSFGDVVKSSKPVKVMSNVTDVSVGTNHAMAIKTDGSLWGWGGNYSGQVGDGTFTPDPRAGKKINNDRATPIKVMANVAAVSAGNGNTYAIKPDGSLWGWGGNMGVDLTTKVNDSSVKDHSGRGEASTGIAYNANQWYATSPLKIMNDVKMG